VEEGKKKTKRIKERKKKNFQGNKKKKNLKKKTYKQNYQVRNTGRATAPSRTRICREEEED